MGLAFIPTYIQYLGVESYGLIGLFALLTAWLNLLDLGMVPTLNREMARFTAGAHTPQSICDLLRSLELIAIALAVIAGLIVWAASGWLASDWLRAEKLPIETVSQAIAIMGVVGSLGFLEGLYRGAILGLQKQVFFNAVYSLAATVRAVGAVGVLVWLSPTIEAYFVWQGIVSLGSLIVLAATTYGLLPKPSHTPRFSRQAISNIWRFAGGMMIIAFLALLLVQVDKILLSRLLSLEAFGYYALASTIVLAISLLVSPVSQAFYPEFCGCVARADTPALAGTYHRSAQLVTVLAAPTALTLIFFSERIMTLWTGDRAIVHEVAPLLTLLSVGSLLNGFMVTPYMLTLAYGWPGYAVRVNSVAVVILVPAIAWATLHYEAQGAAWAWVLLNAGYVLFGIRYLHSRLLPSEMWRWYRYDVGQPLIGAIAATALCSTYSRGDATGLNEFLLILASWTGSAFFTAFFAPTIREKILNLRNCH